MHGGVTVVAKNRRFESNLSKITRPVAAIKSLRFSLLCIYIVRYANGFIVLSFVVIMSWALGDSHDLFIQILLDCIIGTRDMVAPVPVKLSWAHFTNDLFHRISNSMENWFGHNHIVGYHITTKFAHVTTTHLSCYAQNFMTCTAMQLWEKHEISI